jgi:beta-glucosidase
MTSPARLEFPNGFLWGASTSAYQIEGSVHADGRGESIWDRFTQQSGHVDGGDTGDVACDHYRRWAGDVDLIAGLGLNAYRFSIAWPRLFPEGRGRLAREGADHYDRLIDALLDRGIKPLVTLYHWDLPQALQDRGGWRNRETAEAFGEYAALCFERFGDRVPYWITHNEPWIVAVLGHELGIHAPGERDLAGSVRAAHHLLLSHGRAVQALAATGRDASVGVAYSLFPHYPASASQEDRDASQASDGYVNRWYLDPVLRGSYPADMAARYEQAAGPADFIADGDLAAIGARCDFVGVNYYTRRRVAADPAGSRWPWRVEGPEDGVPLTDAGWEIVPGCLTDTLLRLHAEYGGPPLIITENGAVFDDQPGPDGRVHDRRRVSFLHDHLAAVHTAIERGANVLGYFHWSLMDNFEWARGYGQRLGLVHVDYETQQRTVKDSGAYLARVAADNALDVPLTWRAAR